MLGPHVPLFDTGRAQLTGDVGAAAAEEEDEEVETALRRTAVADAAEVDLIELEDFVDAEVVA